jgi:Predicted Zn peptidase
MLSPDQIERRAKQLLHEVNVTQPPVDVRAIARHLKATIRSVHAEEDISGAIVREGDKITIGVNAGHNERRKRFTIAHEIGHLVLHDAQAQVDHSYAEVPSRSGVRLAALRSRISSEAIDPREIEANRFAAALVMPAHLLEHALKKIEFPLTDDAVAALAGQFKVSVQALTFRLINLGIPVDVAGK